MGEAIAFLAIMLIALFVFELAWRVVLIIVGLGPATHSAMAVVPVATHAGLSIPWAIGSALTTWVVVYALTLALLVLMWRALRGASQSLRWTISRPGRASA
jgi:hypothetical protein